MKKGLVLCSLLLLAFSISCRQSDWKKAVPIAPRDTTINQSNSFTGLFFDSATMENFIRAESLHDSLADRIRNFYNTRNYQYAWFLDSSVAEYVPTFLEMQQQYVGYSGDSTLYDPDLDLLVDSIKSKEGNRFSSTDTMLARTELRLTEQFFRFARRAYEGRNNLDKELDWFIPRKKVDLVSLLDSMLKSKGKDVSRYEPVNRQYNLLKDYLVKYYGIEKNGGWPLIKADQKTYKPGDSSAVITQIKKRLFITGDLPVEDSSPVFNTGLQLAVKDFQQRYGLTTNGAVNANLIKEMNRPAGDRIRQMLVNMERIRWVPANPSGDYILINIPEYRLHVYEQGKYEWNMNIVVGAPAHSTVIFSGDLKYVVFSPYWNVPPGILKAEVLPGIRRDKNYLAKHNMEWSGKTVRQKPGPSNALGGVKFLFPNSYNIYLHDTPSRSLFGQDQRAFSHGCIRLQEPAKLARYLLRNEPRWDSSSIAKAMRSGKEQYVTLKDPIPVFIGYFTAWVDRDGKLNFRDDVYGHDKKMAEHLFKN